MATIPPFPHDTIDIIDNSIYVPTRSDDLPLQRPNYAMKTQSGIPGEPLWCKDITVAYRNFGKETFNPLNKDYYSPSSEFLTTTFPKNGAFITRVADPAADSAKLILECSVKSAQIEQYEKDEDGNYVRDANGDLVVAANSPEDGLKIGWMVRTALTAGEELDKLESRTTVDGDGDQITIYPILAFEAVSQGLWGNDCGLKLFWDQDENTPDRLDRVQASFFSIAPIRKEFNASTIDPLRDIYDSIRNSFVFKPESVDPKYQMNVTMAGILQKAYVDDKALPYNVIVYSENIFTLGEMARTVEVNRTDEITSGWLANLISLRDLDNKPYDHVKFTDDSFVLSKDTIMYLGNGTDGDKSDTMIEAQVRNFYQLDTNPQIVDSPRYPFNFIYDTGWSIDTKFVIEEFMAIRKDVKVVMTTQTLTSTIPAGGTVADIVRPNTEMEDESIGSVLRAHAMLVPESIEKGTEAFRASIFMQAGLTHSQYEGIMPYSLWYADKLAEMHNTDIMSDEPAGLPQSHVGLFSKIFWAPSSDSQKSRGWDTGLNYCQYYTMKDLHSPALRTIYRYDTSVLCIDDFSNALIYTKFIVRESWAKFAGVTRPSAVLQQQISDDLTTKLTRMYNGRYTFEVQVYQTDEEKLLGYVQHVRIAITSPAQNRVWTTDIEVNRENY